MSIHNPFRQSLDLLPPPSGAKGSAREAFLAALPLAVKLLFLEQRAITWEIIVETAAPWSVRSSGSDQNLYRCLRSGPPASYSLADPLRNGQEAPRAFDFSGRTPFVGDYRLADLIAAFTTTFGLTSPGVKTTLAATRILLGLDSHTSHDRLLKAASELPVTVFHGLPALMRSALASRQGLSQKSHANYSSALRRMMIFGLEGDLFPLYFPAPLSAAPLEEIAFGTFPTDQRGGRDHLRARRGVRAVLRLIVEDQDAQQPADISDQAIANAVQHAKSPRHLATRRAISGLRLAIRRGVHQHPHPIGSRIVSAVVADGKCYALPYLSASGYTSRRNSLCGVLDALSEHGAHPGWSPLVEHFARQSTQTTAELYRDGLLTTSVRGRMLTPSTLGKRFLALRGLLGVLESRDPVLLREASPEQVLGELLPGLVDEMLTAWSHSSESGQGVSHAASAGLLDHIDGLSQLSKALEDLRARALLDTPATPDPEQMRTQLVLQRVGGYLRAVLADLQRSRRADTSYTGNTVKDFDSALRDTPLHHFITVHHDLLAHVRTFPLQGNLGYDSRRILLVTVLSGVLLSGALRLGEAALLDLEVHFRDGRSVGSPITLRARDRKNRRRHSFRLRPAFLPEWLGELYANQMLGAGSFASARGRLLRHPRTGSGFLNVESERDPNARQSDVSTGYLRDCWQDVMSRFFVNRGFLVPAGAYRFSPHLMRNLLGHATYHSAGLKAAANLLGDSEAIVDRFYARLDGLDVDTSRLLDGAAAADDISLRQAVG